MEDMSSPDQYESAEESLDTNPTDSKRKTETLRRRGPKRKAPDPPKSAAQPMVADKSEPKVEASHTDDAPLSGKSYIEAISNLDDLIESFNRSTYAAMGKSRPGISNPMEETHNWLQRCAGPLPHPLSTSFRQRSLVDYGSRYGDFPLTNGSTDVALQLQSRNATLRYCDVIERLPSVDECRQVQSNTRHVERSDSIVTVAHLCEDILVSNRWRVKVTLTNLTVVVVLTAFFMPNFAAFLYTLFRLIFGTLFPAYYSYKAMRTKNLKEYVKWMMYWIVFAFFTCIETVTDVVLAFWFPFYYEIKILVVLWLLSPATKGSSILYRKFVHPWLIRREDEIDECITKAKQQGYTAVVELGTKGVNYATSIIMQTAIKGGGGLVSQLKRSYSTSDMEESDLNRNVKALQSHPHDEPDFLADEYQEIIQHPKLAQSRQRGNSIGRASRSTKVKSVDVAELMETDCVEPTPQRRSPRTHDMSSSVRDLRVVQSSTTKKMRSEGTSYATLPRTKRTTAKKKQV